jgi:hypothetical protein
MPSNQPTNARESEHNDNERAALQDIQSVQPPTNPFCKQEKPTSARAFLFRKDTGNSKYYIAIFPIINLTRMHTADEDTTCDRKVASMSGCSA